MADHTATRVVVTDVKIPFWSLVSLLVKVTIAAIPAYIILLGIVFVVAAFFEVVGTGLNPN